VDYLNSTEASARVGSRTHFRPIVILVAVVLGGCSWFLPHPERSSSDIGDANTPRDGRCSLAVAQDRRSLPEQIAAEGIPTPLIIHVQSVEPSSSRNISNGQWVDFEASTRDADPPRNYATGMSRHASPAQAIPHSTPWRIEAVDAQGEVLASDARLTSGSLLTLRESEGSGYLRLDTQAASITGPRAEASRFILYKADIPDSTRPTTCDEQIRDEDFVFLRALAPSVWASVGPQGVLGVQQAESAKPASNSHSNPLCARQTERCRTDPQGGLVCVSAPVCAE
jgi:hypothetical protein